MSTLSKRLMIFFGILDAIVLITFFNQIYFALFAIKSVFPHWYIVLEISRVLLLISLGYSAWKLIHLKKSGLIAGYFQFPFRFITLYLSFGFLGRVPSLVLLFGDIQRLMILACVLEGARLAATIAIHIHTSKRDGWQKTSTPSTPPTPSIPVTLTQTDPPEA